MYQSVAVDLSNGLMSVKLNRPDSKNTLTTNLITELLQILDEAERNEQVQVVVLKGCNGVFCTGLDFNEATQTQADDCNAEFMPLLKRISLLSKVVIAQVEGQVTAGGVGLMAACDVVVCNKQSKFSLSEALWGLLPAVVIPFIIRRTGFQPAYLMTITTMPIDAEQARQYHLVDFVEEHPERFIKRMVFRINKISQRTVGDIKQYFRAMWIVNDDMERSAMNEFNRLIGSSEVKSKIGHFVKSGQLPWEQ